jgi:exosortase
LEAAKEMTFRNPWRGVDARAVVLVGGRDFGRCPLAAHLPTALWPLADKPVLARLLDHLAATGFRQAAVCCAKDDAATVGAVCRAAPLKVVPVIEELAAGTAGCLRDAVGADPGNLILVLSAGMLAPPALEDLAQAHQAGGAELTVVFNLGRGREAGLGRPAEIYLCRPEILHHIPRGGYCDIKEGLIPSLLRAGGTIHPVVLDREVGNFHNRAGYLRALEVLFHPAAALSAMASERVSDAPVLTGAEVLIHPTARICGPVLLGDHAQLAAGAVVVGPALIGPKVTVGAESVVVRSALWAEAQVGARCEVRESIVDCHAVLPDDVRIVETTASPRLAGRGSDRHLLQPCDAERPGEGSSFRRWTARLPRLASCSGRQWAYAAGGLLVLAAFLWSNWPTFMDLLAVWRRSDENSSGLLVPLLAAYVLWLRRQDLRSTPVRPALFLGLVAFLFAQAVRGIGLDYFYSFAERLSVVLSLAALVLLVLGWKYLGKVATVLLFLCLMLPWPNRIQSAVTLPLQRWSTTSAVFCLELVGYQIRQDGNVIHIGNASVAVAEACNGLRMITAFFVISGLVVLLVKRAWWEKLIILASSLPIAFLCNTLRLATTAVFFTFIKGQTWEQRFHDWGGYAMMPLALALVVGQLWLLARLTTPPTELVPAIISRRHPQHVPDPSCNGRTGV